MRASRTTAAASSWRRLLIPGLLYALAQIVAVQLPATLGRWLTTGEADFAAGNTVASRDVVSLALALGLRFLILYPVWASLIFLETRGEVRARDDEDVGGDDYLRVWRLCCWRVLPRLAGLHLQAAGMMVLLEGGTYVVLRALLDGHGAAGEA